MVLLCQIENIVDIQDENLPEIQNKDSGWGRRCDYMQIKDQIHKVLLYGVHNIVVGEGSSIVVTTMDHSRNMAQQF